jgi:hypothetical protein
LMRAPPSSATHVVLGELVYFKQSHPPPDWSDQSALF